MFSNFKWPQFLQRMTSSDKDEFSCVNTGQNPSIQPHSMEQFYDDFVVLGEQNKFRNIFGKKTVTSLFESNTSQDLQKENKDNAQILYLKKRQPKSEYIQISKESYDYVAFKIVSANKQHREVIQSKLQKEIQMSGISKSNFHGMRKNPLRTTVQCPTGYYFEEVNAICSEYTYLYLVFKRWNRSIVQRLNEVLVEKQSGNLQAEQKNQSKKLNTFTTQDPYNPSSKLSTVDTSKYSSSTTFMSQRLVNSVSTAGENLSSIDHKNYQQNVGFSNRSSTHFLLMRQLLFMIKSTIKSFQFLKENFRLPDDLKVCDILWREKFTQQEQISSKSSPTQYNNPQKKILTTLFTSLKEQSENIYPYYLAHSMIPRDLLVEMMKAQEKRVQLLNENLKILQQKGEPSRQLSRLIGSNRQTLQTIQKNGYSSPEQLSSFNNAQIDQQSLFSSLLFKLGMITLELLTFYCQILNKKSVKVTKKQIHPRQIESIKKRVYSMSLDQSHHSHAYSGRLYGKNSDHDTNKTSLKVNWLSLSEQIFSLEEKFLSLDQEGDSPISMPQNSQLAKFFFNTLRSLLSRSAIQRKNSTSYVNSAQYVHVASESRNNLSSQVETTKIQPQSYSNSQSRNRAITSESYMIRNFASLMGNRSNVSQTDATNPLIEPTGHPKDTHYFQPHLKTTSDQGYHPFSNSFRSTFQQKNQFNDVSALNNNFIDPNQSLFASNRILSNQNKILVTNTVAKTETREKVGQLKSVLNSQSNLESSQQNNQKEKNPTKDIYSPFLEHHTHKQYNTSNHCDSIYPIPSNYHSNFLNTSKISKNPHPTNHQSTHPKQTIITQSISIVFPSYVAGQYSVNFSEEINLHGRQEHQLQSEKQSSVRKDEGSLVESKDWNTPSFYQSSSNKKDVNQVSSSIKFSPKLPVALFPSSSSKHSNPNPKGQAKESTQQRIYSCPPLHHHHIQKPQLQPIPIPSVQQSSFHRPQLKIHVSISDSNASIPIELPQTSEAKINSPYEASTVYNSRKDDILIQEDDHSRSNDRLTNVGSKGQPQEEAEKEKIQQVQSLQENPQENPSISSPQPSNPHLQSEYVIEEYKGGGRYQGYVSNKKRNGYGKLYYHQGSHYDGQWLDDQMNGYGRLYYSNGQLAYQGKWQKDEFHGWGKVYNDNPTMLDDSFDYTNFNNLEEQWAFYEGELQHDLKEGQGTIMLENGEWFEGEFHNDRINGEGKFTNLEGETICGVWKENVMVEMYE